MKALLATLAFALSSAVQAAPVSEAEFRELQTLATATDQVWNARNAAALSAYYTADATTSIGKTQLNGKTEIDKYFDNSLKNVPAGMTHRTELRRAEKIGDMAFTDTSVFLEVPDAGGKRVVREFTTLALIRRSSQPSGWEFVAVRAIPLK